MPSASFVIRLLLACVLMGAVDGRAAAPVAKGCPVPRAGDARPWLNTAYTPECRAQHVLASFKSLDEKLAVLTAGFGAGDKWLADRGLPVLSGGDGPSGIRGGGPAVTSFPAPIGMAASFDRDTAALYGSTLGGEAYDYGWNSLGGPALDVARVWNFGRVPESLGEDPFLIGELAGAEVRAMQQRHVVSMPKHFAIYTQEQGRAGDHPLRTQPAVDARVSERVMREIYLPGFEAAVKEGRAGRVMCAFPRVNGIYACEHPQLLGILKNEWGFDGLVVPDFPDAQRSIVAAVNAGLDSGLFVSTPPSGDTGSSLATATDNSFNGENLRTAVAQGKVTISRIDDLILRRLVPQFRVGAFDAPARRVAPEVSTPQRREIAADLVARGSVLLKNERSVLPLAPGLKRIAVIGHQAGAQAVVAEVGSAHVNPLHLAPVLPALRARAGEGVDVLYGPGTLGLDRLPLLPAGMVTSPDGNGAGFKAEYVANANLDFTSQPFLVRQEAAVNIAEIPRIADLPANRRWSVRWTGRFTAVEGGIQHFTLNGSGTARLYADERLVGHFENTDFGDTVWANLPLRAGQSLQLRVEWTPRVTFRQAAVDDYGTTLGPVIRLGWAAPHHLVDEAVSVAKSADVAVVFVGHRVGEGMDRQSLALPNDQDALIEAVAAANPNTVVVLQTGGAVTMPWIDRVAAVLEMWLPGDAFGPAAARLLFGDAEPAGRLPLTFPRDEGQGPGRTRETYPGRAHPATGALDTVHLSEGLEVGYRWWDARGEAPLFPFGHGLSYSTFTMHRESVRGTRDGGALVGVRVSNTGARRGAEVVQIYVGFPGAAAEPPHQLKGVAKVVLAPGESRLVSVRLQPRAFQYWDDVRRNWSQAEGVYRIYVGRSSRELDEPLSFTPRGRWTIVR